MCVCVCIYRGVFSFSRGCVYTYSVETMGKWDTLRHDVFFVTGRTTKKVYSIAVDIYIFPALCYLFVVVVVFFANLVCNTKNFVLCQQVFENRVFGVVVLSLKLRARL